MMGAACSSGAFESRRGIWRLQRVEKRQDAGAKQAAKIGQFWNEKPGNHTSGAKALVGLIGLMPGINPRPTARMSFSAACKARIHFEAFSARLKSCPVTRPRIPGACKFTSKVQSHRPKIVPLIVLMLALAWMPGEAQTGAAVGPYNISGTVVNALTGEPVRRATVAVLSEVDSHTVQSAETDREGRFNLERLPAAKYQLTASKRGYLTAFYLEHEEYSTAIVTGEGQDTANLTFRLMPGAVLFGTIAGDGGDRLEGAKVLLFQRPPGPASMPGKGDRITQEDSATTDDTGAYEFDGLAAGEYLLAVTAEPWFALHHSGGRKRTATREADGKNAALDVAYPVTFFDSTTDEASAARIQLADGKRVEANINLRAVPALRLVVETPQKPDGSIARAELRQTIFGTETSNEVAGFQDAKLAGTIEFNGVAPGRYELVQGDPPRIANLEATASVQVDTDVGVPVLSVSGLLRIASGSALAENVTVTLDPLDDAGRRAPLHGVAFKGAFSFPMVPPGRWEMWVQGAESQISVLSISAGGRTQSGNRVTVKNRPLSIMVTLNQNGTRIQGLVRKGGKGVAGAMVVLVPRDPAGLRSLARRDQSDSDGSFSLRDVAPGQYTVVAIEDGWDLDWAGPGALDRFLGGGIAVAVAEKSGKLITVPAPVPAQSR
jgi:uncharacterized surface anchored protein